MSRRTATLAAIILALALFFALDLHHYLRLSTIKAARAQLSALYEARPVLFVAGFMAVHITALALCLPGAVLTMALAGGAIFGPAAGTMIVLISLTIGDSLGFLAARFLIGDLVRKWLSSHLERVEREMDENGAFYLLSLRLIAAMPYFIVNLTFGISRMRLRTFAPVSFIGLAPATALYVNAGTEIGRIESAGDVLSPRLLLAFVLLSLAPIVGRLVLAAVGARRRARSSE